MGEYLDVAVEVSLKAGRLVKDMSKEILSVTLKGEVDLVTEVDVISETLIVDGLKARFPNHGFLAEERGGIQVESDYTWIIDPIDGTTNYAHSFPVYAVSVGLEYKGEVIVGVIYDPNLDELFTAEKGRGAFLNNEPIRVSSVSELDRSLLATGFPYYFRKDPERILRYFTDFSLKAQGIRRAGAATIDLTALACGRFDGYWELGLKPWDMAAGTLIASEAGARITKLDGSKLDIRVPEILATNDLIHDQMLEIIGESLGR
ncbi:MAG: inositol monophosphatase [Actinobacteria bacterium]|nr:inositol monophosphatase [Actinomycetota bacterium]